MTSHPTLRAAALAVALSAPAAARADQPTELDITLDVEVGEPVMLADRAQTAYLKITVGGGTLAAVPRRPPINLALVLDRSSSMSGDKLEKAKEAALAVVDRLQDDDIISIVTYDSTVEVLVPASRAQERDHIRARIEELTPRGSTALFAGVSHGIHEVEKFLDRGRVNRIILLSDGQANVGPSSPNELGRLGAAAAESGVSITTIGLGLGYNEDLMMQLALRSDGNHAFAQDSAALARVFQYELGDIMAVVGQDLEIVITFADGVRPLRSLNRDAAIHGNRAVLSLNQLYAKQEKFFLLEVAVPPGAVKSKRDLAQVELAYDDMVSKKRGRRSSAIGVAFSDPRAAVQARQNRTVLAAAVEAIATEKNQRAVALRDQGKADEAEKLLLENAVVLGREGKRLGSQRLIKYGKDNESDAKNLDGEKWNRQRKIMIETSHGNSYQQPWSGQ